MRYVPQEQQQFEQHFATWNIGRNPHADDPRRYIMGLLNGEHKKCLIHLPASDITALNIAIQTQARATGHPVFYIHSPDDLVCSAPFVIREDGNRGRLSKNPGGGGPLHDFLTADHAQPPILMVNYSNFSADDVVRLNGLLDIKRQADGTPLPENTVFIGLMDPDKPGAYNGADFYSRFDKVEQCPLTTIPPLQPVLKPFTAEQSGYVVAINLCHASNWMNQLMGGWIIDHGQLYFQEGKLLSAIASRRPILIQNPPVDSAFDVFWQQARLRGRIYYAGRDYPFPEQLECFSAEGYDWTKVKERISWMEAGADALVLNPGTLSEFLVQYQFDQAGLFTRVPGLLEQHATSAVDILVTRSLSEDEWGLFLNEAQQYEDLKLQISYVPGVILPEALAYQRAAASLTIPAWDKAHHAHTICIVADDPDLAISHLCKAHKDCMVFNISECSPSDLLIRIDGKLNGLEFVFSQKEQALLSALKEGKTVVLTGSFSDELLDGLAAFIRQRTAGGSVLGQLILLSQKPIGFMEAVALEATVEEKHQALVAQGYSEAALANLIKDNPSCMKTESFCSLVTRLNFLGQHPDISSQHAWDGLGTLRPSVQIKAFDPKSSKKDATAYLKARLDAFHQVIDRQPYVFLAGLTGVGKSRFVENELGDRTIFFGENAILAWIKSKDKNPSLFLDEANLSPRQWSEFEGLFNTPPSILIDGTYHVLTPAHKVIFAGNPLSYGDERKLAPLFARHGNSIVFEPLSNAFIYEKTLKPILEDMFSSKQCGQIAQELLAVYDFLIGISKDEVLISPRQIQMMALAVIEYHQRFPEANIIDIAKFQARHLAAPLVPKQHLERFNDMFPAIDRSMMLHGHEAVKPKFKKFLATPSRDNALWQLTDFLSLRRFQRETESDNPQLCLGGLHRFVIEGEPGIGKSEMAVELMVGMGLHELRLKDKHPAKNSNGFYRLFASMPPKVQEDILLTAFDEGAIVLIDEINSMPTLEKLLNSLLDGKHTNEDNRPPHVPGFRVLGTQNPPTMAGRRLASPALANRTQTVHLSAYPKEEMEQILEKMGWLSAKTKTELVAAFQHQVNEANKRHLSPAPSFRDFIKTAEQVIEGHVKARIYPIIEHLGLSKQEMAQIVEKMKGLSPTISAQLIAAFEQEATKSRPLRDVNDLMKPVLERHFNTRMHTVVQETLYAYFEARANPQTRTAFIAFIHEVEQIEKEGVTVIWASIKDEVARQMFDEFSAVYANKEDPRFKALIEEGKNVKLDPLPSFQKQLLASKGYREYCRSTLMPSGLFHPNQIGEPKDNAADDTLKP